MFCRRVFVAALASELLACLRTLLEQIQPRYDGCGTRLAACRIMTDSHTVEASLFSVLVQAFPPGPQSFIDLVRKGTSMAGSLKTLQDYVDMYTTFENALVAAPWCVEGWVDYSMSFERGGEFGDALAAMRYAAMFQRGPIARATLTRIAYLQARVTQINAENARNYPAAPTPPPLASTPQPSIAGSLSGSAAAELQ